jgi:hypothetical protein
MRDLAWQRGTRQGLSKAEKRLLRRMSNAKGGESIVELCKDAKTTTKTYYKLIHNPKLGSMLPQAIDFLVGEQMLPVIANIIQRSLSGSAKHSELLLKLANLIGDGETKVLQIFGQKGEGMDVVTERINRFLLDYKGKKDEQPND